MGSARKKIKVDEANCDEVRPAYTCVGTEYHLERAIQQHQILSHKREHATSDPQVSGRRRLAADATSFPATADSHSYYPEGQLGEEMRELERRFLSGEIEEDLPSRSALAQPIEPVDKPMQQLQAIQRGQDTSETFRRSATITEASRRSSLLERLSGEAVSSNFLNPFGHHTQQEQHPIQAFLRKQSPQATVAKQSPRPHGIFPPPQRKPTPPAQPLGEEAIVNNGSGYVIPVVTQTDQMVLARYQTLIRSSLEYFTAVQEDVTTTVQGRRQKVLPNQVGIRCRHCSHLPISCRVRGAVYYPKTLSSLYQGAQNIASVHFPECTEVPSYLLEQIVKERGRRSIDKAGRPYWSEMCQSVGIYEADGILRMVPPSKVAGR